MTSLEELNENGIDRLGWAIPMPDGYRIERLGASDAAGPDDVLALWEREGAVSPEEAQRRVHEVVMVAIAEAKGLVGVTTAYLQRNDELRMDLWYARAFVASGDRAHKLSFLLTVATWEWLKEQFTSGADSRGSGMLFEVQYEGWKTWYPEAFWPPTEFTFIGENERGDHVRVHWFPGAEAPVPAAEPPR